MGMWRPLPQRRAPLRDEVPEELGGKLPATRVLQLPGPPLASDEPLKESLDATLGSAHLARPAMDRGSPRPHCAEPIGNQRVAADQRRSATGLRTGHN